MKQPRRPALRTCTPGPISSHQRAGHNLTPRAPHPRHTHTHRALHAISHRDCSWASHPETHPLHGHCHHSAGSRLHQCRLLSAMAYKLAHVHAQLFKTRSEPKFTHQYSTSSSPKFSNFCCIKIPSVPRSESRTTGRPSPLALKAHAQRLTARGLEPHAVWAQVPARPPPDTWPGRRLTLAGLAFSPVRRGERSTPGCPRVSETRVKGWAPCLATASQ